MTVVATPVPLARDATVPLCVDLDGTLLRTDLLFEGVARLLARRPAALLGLPLALLRGRAALKQYVTSRAELGVAELPLRAEVVALATEARRHGRRVLLVTASDQAMAEQVAAQTGLFDEVQGSGEGRNLKGRVKAQWLVERFGRGGFDYVGDARADVPVWQAARCSYVVGPLAGRPPEGLALTPLPDPTPAPAPWQSWRRALRPHQWIKNLLVLVPTAAGGRLLDPGTVGTALVAALLFSLVASGTYVLNDIVDVQSDRAHATKRRRPFAAGHLELRDGLLVGPALVLGATLAGYWITPALGLTLAAYTVLTLAYSLRFKSAVLIDVMLLAALYAMRLLAGGVATGIPLSFWLLAFTIFAFYSLALAKRYAELERYPAAATAATSRRGYRASDALPVLAIGTGAGLASAVILALYINGGASGIGYEHPTLLWLIVPALLYWVSRVWIVAARGEMNDDPIVWALRDGISRMLAIVVLGLFVVARYLP